MRRSAGRMREAPAGYVAEARVLIDSNILIDVLDDDPLRYREYFPKLEVIAPVGG